MPCTSKASKTKRACWANDRVLNVSDDVVASTPNDRVLNIAEILRDKDWLLKLEMGKEDMEDRRLWVCLNGIRDVADTA